MTPQEHVPLARYSTMHIGGPARYFVAAKSDDEVKDALTWADDRSLPTLLLGGGSNMLISDEGFPGLVIKMEQRAIDVAGREVSAQAGAITRLVVLAGVRQGLTGMEHLAGIPGTIGGAVRGNAGSFGSETKDHLIRVEVLHRTLSGWQQETLPRESLEFSYRTSTFKKDPSYAILRAVFSLETGDATEGERRVNADLASRREKQPYEFPSMGSVFTNPGTEQFAGRLIEEAGLKGFRIGGAEVSVKHANFIINRGGATAADVLALAKEIKRRVQEHSGVLLSEEILLVR